MAYAFSGKTDKAEKMLARLDALSNETYVSPLNRAIIYMGFGDKDKTFEYLEKAYLERDPFLVYGKVQPIADSVRSDPRFIALMKKIGLEE